MRYMLIICAEEEGEMARADDETAALMQEYGKFWDEMSGRGLMKDGARLRPTTDATTVRVRNGETLTADGPFAETKEQIGGFYVVDCKDLDEAIEVASKIPNAKNGTIEIRPIWEM
jgi:hypothetical protein